MNSNLQDRVDQCRATLRLFKSVVVAFSAGVDSTFLLALSVETLGAENVLAVMGISPSLARRERQAGRNLAQQIGAELVEIETGELTDPNYSANTPERCFYCKSDLFRRLKNLAAKRGFRAVVSGANADDAGDFRPGMKAAKELGGFSPLMEAGLTKNDIRDASRAMRLPTWNKPAMACLASRVPYGRKVTEEVLARVESAEDVLKALGFAQCRIRDHYPVARIEVPTDEILAAVELRRQIVEGLKSVGYTYVSLDLEGFRSGSMNDVLPAGITRSDDVSS
ncbi:MAG: ATP-dependent sacrificial sulfur transferase LarE [Planctomycetota bacterium]|nr:ATP-dependent sacrificial sulfur transferase LarE [Planctomycetota bacterium]